MNAVNAMVYFVLREATVKLITIMSECFVAVPVKAGHSNVFVCVCVCHGHIQQERQHGTRIENLPVQTRKHREHQLLKGVNAMVHVKQKYNVIKTYITI